MAEQKRAALIAAVLRLADKGSYRAGAQELADLAGVRRQAVCRYFGSVDILYRVVAREQWQQVTLPPPFDGFDERARKAAVWLVLVGKPRD